MLRPSVYKPEQYILKPVRQIWGMESTETSQGKKKLIDAGFIFTFHTFSADSTKRFWRCVIRSCQCRLHTDVNDVIVNRLGHHTHGSDAAGVEVAKIKANAKNNATSSPGYNGTAVAIPFEPWIQWKTPEKRTWRCPSLSLEVHRWPSPCPKGERCHIWEYVRGEPGPVKRREYILADQRLLATVNDYNNRDIIRPVTSLGHQEGWTFVWEGPDFFELCPKVSHYNQHIFPRGAKNF